MASYRPTDGAKRTEVVPILADTDRAHEFEVVGQFQAEDSGCGQRAGWVLYEARLLSRSYKRSRKVVLKRELEDEIVDLFERFVADDDGYDR